MSSETVLIKGRYQLGRPIGGGGMGNVYLGTDALTGETVAIKQLRVEMTTNMPELVERFLREGEALRRLNHPNIVKVLATCDEENQHYIVMEYVTGGSLADLLKKQPRLPVEQVVSIGLELSDALSRAHHLHILHRDIKPANILLAEDGTPRLTDFGLARIGQLQPLTQTGSIMGTFGYVSPEVIEQQEVNERSDIWSFGIVLYEMLAGRLPFNGETPFEVIWAIKQQPLPPLDKLRDGMPQALVSLVGRMLRKDNPARVHSARQVGVELESIQKGLGTRTALPVKVASSSAVAGQSTKIRVLIVDDHAVVRQGLRMFIDLQDDMEVVGEGTNGVEAVEMAGRFSPDVVLLDLVMPQMDGVAATGRIKAACPGAHVIILTSFGEDDKVFPAIRAGAQGYLLKDIRPNELVQAVREAYQGKTQLHPAVAQKLMAAISDGSKPGEKTVRKVTTRPTEDGIKRLTRREEGILRLLAAGKNNREIAESLNLSEKTIKTHISIILNKLDLLDRQEAAAWAREHLESLP
jgi:DNA-binding NarL/FixJ family response regulator